jgi:hypothetical protein
MHADRSRRYEAIHSLEAGWPQSDREQFVLIELIRINREDFVQHPDQHQPNGLILRQSASLVTRELLLTRTDGPHQLCLAHRQPACCPGGWVDA